MENSLPEAVTFTVDCGPFEKFFTKSKTRTFRIPRQSIGAIIRAATYFPCLETQNETEAEKLHRELRIIAAGITLPAPLFGIFSLPFFFSIPRIEIVAHYLHKKLKDEPEKISNLALVVIQMCDLHAFVSSIVMLQIKSPANKP